MESVSREVTQNGPHTWLQYFENSDDFYMASEGILVFPNYDSAKVFVNNKLVKLIDKIDLRWKNIRVDVIDRNFASVAATYHEDKTNAGGIKDSEDGYFSGLAHWREGKWKLRNAHWSMMNTHAKQ
ncbi:MAG: hypothetical protein C5B59_18565 [Bacteroidetes bacterium]|nr:MAG: hypothetical protein C5B59_18565 [Bacteroidota bacterium]